MTLDDAGPVIESIDILRVAIPYDSGRRRPATAGDTTLNAAAASVERMECLLVKVVDSDGRTGWGEAFGHAVNPVTFAALRDLVGPLYLGTPARPGAAPQADHALHAFGRSGPVLFAQSGIDIALWDLAAQRAGLPLRRLLNSHAADQVESYASLMVYGNESEEVARRTKYAAEQGFWGSSCTRPSTRRSPPRAPCCRTASSSWWTSTAPGRRTRPSAGRNGCGTST